MPPNPVPDSAQRRTPTVRLGGFSLTGPLAVIFQLVVLGLMAWLFVYMRPRIGMLLSGGIWVAFLIYWSVAAKNSAPATRAESSKSRAIHQAILNGSLLLLFIPVPGLTRWFLPASPYLVPVGLAVQTAFFLLAAWARRHLGRNWSGEVSIKSEHKLVRSGPYRFIRHPIYTAMFGMYVGTCIVSAQIHSLVALALLAIAYGRKIPMEEKALRETFGADYDSYRRHSWALIPGLL